MFYRTQLTNKKEIEKCMLKRREKARQQQKQSKYWTFPKRKQYQKQYWKKYKIKRYKQDIKYKLLCLMRSRLYTALKKNHKSASTLQLVGCSIQQLKEYLEKQFQKGMSWNNNNKKGWEIDHIIPCELFDLSKKSEQKKCFHYTNLQPLWAKKHKQKHVNLKKGRNKT